MRIKSVLPRLPQLRNMMAVIVILAMAVGCAPAATVTEPPAPAVQATNTQPVVAAQTDTPAVAQPSATVAIEATATNAPAQVPQATLDLANLSPDIPDPDKPVTVTFASWVGSGQAWQDLAKKFNELHPNITIEFQDVPAEEITTKLLTQVAGNNPPDVAFLDSSAVGQFATRNALVDLGSYISKSKAVDINDYVPAYLQAAKVNDKVYGLPIDAETTGLFYRTDLFEAAGLDPQKPPTTWDEFEAAAKALTQPDKKQYGFAIFAPEAAYYWYPWLWQAGGDLMTPDGSDIAFDSPAGKKAAEFYVGLKNYTPPDLLNSNSWDGRVAFANGTVAMYEAGAWFAGTLQSEFPDENGKWATAPLPKDQRCATTIAGDTLVIFQLSKNKDAAWKWIEFVSAPENMTLINLGTKDAPTTLLPPRQSLLNDPKTFEANPVLKGFADNMECAVTSVANQSKWPEIENSLNENLGKAIYGELDAATAIDEAAKEARDILKQ